MKFKTEELDYIFEQGELPPLAQQTSKQELGKGTQQALGGIQKAKRLGVQTREKTADQITSMIKAFVGTDPKKLANIQNALLKVKSNLASTAAVEDTIDEVEGHKDSQDYINGYIDGWNEHRDGHEPEYTE